MLTFTQYLNESIAKKIPFQKTIKELHKNIYNADIDNLTIEYKPYFSKLNNEIASFNYPISVPNIDTETSIKNTEEILKKIIEFLNVSKSSFNILKLQSHTSKLVFKNSYGWDVEIDFKSILNNVGNTKKTFGTITIIGPKTKPSQENFSIHPEIKQGTILVHSVGYSMTTVSFYKVKNRSNMKVTCVPLKTKNVDIWQGGGQVVPTSQEGTNIYTGRITKSGTVEFEKLSGMAIVWNGQPQTFTNTD